MLVTRDIAAVGSNENTPIALKNCAPFRTCVTHIINEHVETADNLDVIMSMYNLLEYGDNYADSSGSLWQFKRNEQNITSAGNPDNATTDNSSSFKYKADLLESLISKDVAANNPDIAGAHKFLLRQKKLFQ